MKTIMILLVSAMISFFAGQAMASGSCPKNNALAPICSTNPKDNKCTNRVLAATSMKTDKPFIYKQNKSKKIR